MRFALLKTLAPVSIISVALCLSGCLESTQQGPPRLFEVEEETAFLKSHSGLPDLDRYRSLSSLDQQNYRNNYVADLMLSVDINYYAYEAALTQERQKVGFASDAVNIALTGGSALVGASEIKTVLAQSAAGLTGIRAAYSDDVLLNRTMDILQAQMRANRNVVASTIIRHLRLSSSEYNLSQALSEIEEYYQAGTLTGALIGVSNSTALNADVAKSAKDASITASSLASDDTAKLLMGYISPNGVYDKSRATQLQNVFRKLNIDSRLEIVLEDPKMILERARLLKAARANGINL